jgi:transposase InsO family protein
MFHCPQISLRASDTLRGKQQFEQFAAEFDISIKKFHSDNGVFCSDEFMANIHSNGQKISFSGVGAHHQNGVAERAIRTVWHVRCPAVLAWMNYH